MERLLPMEWFIPLLTLGNRTFEQLLTNTSNVEQLKYHKHYYNENSKIRDLINFKDELHQLSPSRLIERVKNYAEEVQQLHELIGGYKWKLRYLDKLRIRNKELETLVNDKHEKAKEFEYEKVILGEKFDEAFTKQ